MMNEPYDWDKHEAEEEAKQQPTPPPSPVKLSRKARKLIDHSDPDHTCSEVHVRIPAHCRVKRAYQKKEIGLHVCITCKDLELTASCKRAIESNTNDTYFIVNNLVCNECKHERYVIFNRYFGTGR
jgi:hypothetical protein